MSSAGDVTRDFIIDRGTDGRYSELSALTAAGAMEVGKILPWRRLRGICDCDRYGQLRLPHRLWCVSVRNGVGRGHTDTLRKESNRTIQTRLDWHGGIPWTPNRRQGRKWDRDKGL